MSTQQSSPRPSEEESFHTGRVVIISMVAALGGFLFGFDTAVINGAVPPQHHHTEVLSACSMIPPSASGIESPLTTV